MIHLNDKLVSSVSLFQGPADNPFLAPRAALLSKGRLIVSDTGQNRVFIWNELPKQKHQEPDVVLGQTEAGNTMRNSGGEAHASSLLYPSGLWSDGKRLLVADAWNHRVLIWHEFPRENSQAADVVLGQPDFHGNLPNVRGITAKPSARSLNWPYGLFSNGKALWIADTGNRRILYFDNIPEESFAEAQAVIGKSSFEERDYDPQFPIWPYSVRISDKGQMAVADTQYYRVLLWHHWREALHKPADVVIGQADLNSNGQNQYKLFPEAYTLNWCYDSCFYREGLWVADTGNSRLLWFDSIPQKNNQAADDLLGQKDFNTGSENERSIRSTEDSYYWPFFISIEGNTMVVADTGNHRIVINELSAEFSSSKRQKA